MTGGRLCRAGQSLPALAAPMPSAGQVPTVVLTPAQAPLAATPLIPGSPAEQIFQGQFRMTAQITIHQEEH